MSRLTQTILASMSLLTMVPAMAQTPPGVDASAPRDVSRGAGMSCTPPFNVTVRSGMSLNDIGREAGQNWRDLVRWNALSGPGDISVGQVLRVQPPECGTIQTSTASALPSTPEAALRRYWVTRDEMLRMSHEIDMKIYEDSMRYRAVLRPHVTQELFESFLYPRSVLSTYSRHIESIAAEGAEQATISTVIRNTTPIPPGAAEPAKWEAERRQNGEKYKYTLRRGSSGWLVAEIYRWDEYRKQWDLDRPKVRKPGVESMTFLAP